MSAAANSYLWPHTEFVLLVRLQQTFSAARLEYKMISDVIDKIIKDKLIPGDMSKEYLLKLVEEKGIVSEGMSEEEMIQKIVASVNKGNVMSEWIDGLMLSDAEPKNEIMLFPYGTFEHQTYGKLVFNDEFFNNVIDNYKSNVLGIKPFMDIEHEMGKSLAWFEDAPYIKKGEGLFAKPKWTKLGKELLSDEIYKYFSPWYEDFVNPVDGKLYKNVFRGGAATNIPFLKVMPAISDTQLHDGKNTSVNIQLSEICEYSNGEKSFTPKGTELHTDRKNSEKKIVEKILIGGHYMTLEEIQKENERILSEAKKKDEALEAMQKQLSESNKLAEEARLKVIAIEADAIVGKALSEGRILPKDKDYWTKRYIETPERTKEDIEHLQVSVSLSEEIGSDDKGERNVSNGKDAATKLHEMAMKHAKENKIAYSDAVHEISLSGEGKKLAEIAAKTNYRLME